MSLWYTIGEGSPYDSGIEIAELLSMFHARGSVSDVSNLYSWYRSMMSLYRAHQDNLRRFDLRRLYKDDGIGTEHGAAKVQVTREFCRECEGHLSTAEDLYSKITLSGDTSRRFDLIDYITEAFISMSRNYTMGDQNREKRSSFDQIASKPWGFRYCIRHKSGDECLHAYLIPNVTGKFGFSVYLYALTNRCYLWGLPSDYAKWDNEFGTPLEFLDHEIEHTLEMKEKVDLGGVRKVFERIMVGDHSKEEKALLCFGLWFCLHETNIRNVKEIRRENYVKGIIKSNDTDYTVTISNKTLSMIAGIHRLCWEAHPDCEFYSNPEVIRWFSDPSYRYHVDDQKRPEFVNNAALLYTCYTMEMYTDDL